MSFFHIVGRFAATFLILGLSACSALPGHDAQKSPPIQVTATGESLAESQLLLTLEKADYVILGERHDNEQHHTNQLVILQALYRTGWLKQLSLEMLRPGQQAGMDEAYVRKLSFSDELRDTIGWDKNWNWDYYGPIVAWAIANQIPLRSANMDREEMMQIYRQKEAFLPEVLDAEAIAVIREQIRESHCGMADNTMLNAMTRIQQARDTRMADSLLLRERGVALLAGAFHARRDVGVPRYVHHQQPEAILVSVGFIEAETTDASGLPDLTELDSAYDVAWFTAMVDRQTPCEMMKK